ncbi:MAG: TIGR02300 family protein [Pseudomonadota bacterium]
MSKPELGVKRDCPECGARFYDLNKDPAHCPKCEHEFVPESILKPRKTRAEEESDGKPKDEAEKPEQETSLESADEEKKAAPSKRAAALDEENDDEDDDDDELANLGDIDVDLDDDDEDDDNTGLLDDDDDDDDVSSIVKPGDDDD